MFKLGDRIRKVKGYSFVGTVVAVFKNLEGEDRLVAQVDKSASVEKLLFIFNPEQLENERPV